MVGRSHRSTAPVSPGPKLWAITQFTASPANSPLSQSASLLPLLTEVLTHQTFH